jgi:hypothetical protein
MSKQTTRKPLGITIPGAEWADGQKHKKQRMAKGLLCSNSQTCTLSQNGYGAQHAIPS